MSTRALEALDRVLSRGGEPDDVLRATVEILIREPGITWAGIAFLEDGDLVGGPESGTADVGRRIRVPIAYEGRPVGELAVDGEAEWAFLERVALLVSAHALIGWDTRGEAWEP